MSRYGVSFAHFASICLVVMGILAKEGTVVLGSKTYVVPQERMDWYRAHFYCMAKQMDLVAIESAEESARLVEYLDSIFEKGEPFWTSGNNIGDLSRFVWSTGGKAINYTNWAEHEPNNQDGNERCIELINGKWSVRNCAIEFLFVCEKRF